MVQSKIRLSLSRSALLLTGLRTPHRLFSAGTPRLSAFYRLNLHNRRTGRVISPTSAAPASSTLALKDRTFYRLPPAGPVRSTPHYLT
jgi:hypothetical protein